MSSQVIVVGGGLAGLSAAHTVIEQGGVVLLFDKKPFLGGNSVKATSGINGALTRTQRSLGINDSPEKFEEDTALSGSKGSSKVGTPLGKVLTHDSGPAVEWLMDSFDLDLSIVSRMGGHSEKRCHRGKERFPGMTITMALLEKLEKIEKESNGKVAKIMAKSKVTKFITENKKVIGVEFEDAKGNKGKAYGPVIVATGGYGADFSKTGILLKYRPDLENYSTTNGDHCTGDGIKMAVEIGASLVDMEYVQVHPTGLVNPKEPNAKVKFLAAEALRGSGGILINPEGKRFCNELGRRDYVSAEMEKGKGPYRLVLNSKCSKEIEWHCKHYEGRGLMKRYESAEELAKDMKIDPEVLEATFKKYNDNATPENDEFGKKYHSNLPFIMDDYYYVAIVTPVIHYCMGGLKISTKSEVMAEDEVIPGLFATGEVCGGVHGKNRLGGSSLLDCVVFGRVSGRSATKFILENLKNVKQLSNGEEKKSIGISIGNTLINFETKNNKISISWDKSNEKVEKDLKEESNETKEETKEEKKEENEEKKEEKKEEETKFKFYTAEEVAKHNTEDDCWVIVNGEVLDVTSFLNEHPGGRGAILLFAGKDASSEFNMLHKPDVVQKYSPQSIIGKLAGNVQSKL